MNRRLHIGLFERESDLFGAIDDCVDRGVRIVDACSPYPLHGIDERIGIPRSRLTLVCFIAGLAGLSVGLFFQYWTSAVDWPTNVGGKPFDSLPAFLPIAFEMTVLSAGLATALMLLVRSRLWPGKKRRRVIEGVTDDRFALIIAEENAALRAGEVRSLLTRHGAVDCWEEIEE